MVRVCLCVGPTHFATQQHSELFVRGCPKVIAFNLLGVMLLGILWLVGCVLCVVLHVIGSLGPTNRLVVCALCLGLGSRTYGLVDAR